MASSSGVEEFADHHGQEGEREVSEDRIEEDPDTFTTSEFPLEPPDDDPNDLRAYLDSDSDEE